MNSRQKGARGERELANLLKTYGYDARRGQQFSGANGDADVVGLPDIHIEVKRVEKLNIDNAMAQSIRDARDGEKPAVFHRKDRKQWLVTMPFTEWIELYKAWEKRNE
jgi:Holliday junction resolvase